MYTSFDILPILNWHNFLKTGNYAFLCKENENLEDFSEELINENYEKLINSLGERKLLNGFYAKTLQAFIEYKCYKDAKRETEYNRAFFAYLEVLKDNVQQIIINKKSFSNTKEAYNYYHAQNGHFDSLQNRLADFNYSKFPAKEYKFDLFSELANIENFLKRSIDPVKTSVNHYNAIKEQVIKQNKKK